MQGFETPSQRLRNAIPTATLSHIQRLARKVEDLRNPHPSTRATSLAVATQAGRLDVVEWLLEQGHDEGEISRDTLGDTIVHIGAAHGQMDILELYLELYPFVIYWINAAGASPLHTACEKGQVEAAALCIEYGSDVNMLDFQGNSPLHYAMSWGKTDVMLVLLEYDCDTEVKNNAGFTASDYAYSFAIVKTLTEQLKRKAKDKDKNSEKRSRSSKSPRPQEATLNQQPFLLPRSASDASSFAPSLPGTPGTPDDRSNGLLSPDPAGSPSYSLSPRETARIFRATSAKSSPKSPNSKMGADMASSAVDSSFGGADAMGLTSVDAAPTTRPLSEHLGIGLPPSRAVNGEYEHEQDKDRTVRGKTPSRELSSPFLEQGSIFAPTVTVSGDEGGDHAHSDPATDTVTVRSRTTPASSTAISRASTMDSRLELGGQPVRQQPSRQSVSAISTASEPPVNVGTRDERAKSGSRSRMAKAFRWKRRASLPASSQQHSAGAGPGSEDRHS